MPPLPSSPAPAAPGQPAKELFRPQAVAYAGSRQYGTVLLDSAPHQRMFTAFFMATVLAIVLFFFFFEVTRKAQCQGVLLPTSGVLRVLSGQAGTVTRVLVKEGQLVQAGDVMFELTSERSNSNAVSTQHAISTLLESRRESYAGELGQLDAQSRLRVAAVRRRIEDLAQEHGKLASQLALQQARVALAEQAMRRFDELQKKHFISPAQLQDKQAELLDQRQRLADIERASSVSTRERSAAQAELSDLQIQGQRERASVERNISALQQDLAESEARRELLVRAPRSGAVTAIVADLGETVAGNTVLASVLPSGADLEAEIYAPSRSVGFIRPGMVVLLRYQAYPYQKFGQYKAVVREIAETSIRPQELNAPGAGANASGEPLYRIRLKLERQAVLAYGKQMPLKPGMLIDASVQLEHRRLYEWVLAPLFNITGRLSSR